MLGFRLVPTVVLLVTVAFASNAVPASSSAPPVQANPRQVVFGATRVGEVSAPREIRWINRSDRTIHVFNWVLYTGEDFDFWNFQESSCAQLPVFETVELPPHGRCSFGVIFH